jgi:hypothetical protein
MVSFIIHIPLLYKEGSGEVESVLLPHLASPYKGEELAHPFFPLAPCLSPLAYPHHIFPASVCVTPAVFIA